MRRAVAKRRETSNKQLAVTAVRISPGAPEATEGECGFNYQDWQTAAQFCADNKINLEEALNWADKAINGPFRGATIAHEDFSTLSTKAAVLEALGREAEADAVMQKALHWPGTDAYSIYAYGMGLLGKDKKDKAMKVFTFNQQQHPQDKFWTSLDWLGATPQ